MPEPVEPRLAGGDPSGGLDFKIDGASVAGIIKAAPNPASKMAAPAIAEDQPWDRGGEISIEEA